MAAETPVRHGRDLLRLEEAQKAMLSVLEPLPVERVPVDGALGRVLAEPLDAILTLPPWDNSAMDGFAVRAADLGGASRDAPVRLPVIGEVAAGHVPDVAVRRGTAVRILTGGIVPRGADGVVPVEDTDAPPGVAERPETVAVFVPVPPGANVRLAGGDLTQGERILDAGVVLTPARLAAAAAAGHSQIPVHRRPRVAVLATGDELADPGRPVGPAQIVDSNSVSLRAQATAAGADVLALGIAPDRREAVLERLRYGIERSDVVIASGGVSVGAHDLVKDAFEVLGRLDLWRVAIQPGKPLAFGRAPRGEGGECLLFGLPGNPVSSFVTFELFVRPVLRRLAGHRDPAGRRTEQARLTGPVAKSAGRRAFLRVRLDPDPDRPGSWLATLAGGQGSHVLSALARSDALAVVPEDVGSLPAGALVDVIRLEGGEG